jgi:hypothetical protein
MSEDINSGLIQDVRDLDSHAMHASPADGTDGDRKADSDGTDRGGDTDGDTGADNDGTDSGDSDGTDSDSDGTDSGDADGTDNA